MPFPGISEHEDASENNQVLSPPTTATIRDGVVTYSSLLSPFGLKLGCSDSPLLHGRCLQSHQHCRQPSSPQTSLYIDLAARAKKRRKEEKKGFGFENVSPAPRRARTIWRALGTRNFDFRHLPLSRRVTAPLPHFNLFRPHLCLRKRIKAPWSPQQVSFQANHETSP